MPRMPGPAATLRATSPLITNALSPGICLPQTHTQAPTHATHTPPAHGRSHTPPAHSHSHTPSHRSHTITQTPSLKHHHSQTASAQSQSHTLTLLTHQYLHTAHTHYHSHTPAHALDNVWAAGRDCSPPTTTGPTTPQAPATRQRHTSTGPRWLAVASGPSSRTDQSRLLLILVVCAACPPRRPDQCHPRYRAAPWTTGPAAAARSAGGTRPLRPAPAPARQHRHRRRPPHHLPAVYTWRRCVWRRSRRSHGTHTCPCQHNNTPKPKR